ncbi:LD-carboxypeptidase [Maribacter sp. MJ134]|uniref:S66 peptidase family protein n=1 Tax=Maribacter sp. MJ134 TaxID=2496865 RepID=UPI000F845687|nr:LD-carboxypeptidase [Maribacter sp. MJ134]AZQ58668.1 LD-carboxypeptidase [Maribacter sp. MJ134]
MHHSRRRFFNGLMGLSLTTLAPYELFSKTENAKNQEVKILPKGLRTGDTIGLIAPGYTFPAKVLEETKQTLTAMGFIPYYTERLNKRHGYFSNTDAERAKDLNHMFNNTQVDAVLCVRGGYGCTRIMSLIDYEAIQKNPKALIGFSDVTALLNGIYKMTGLVTFHGPVGSTLNDVYSQKSLSEILTSHRNLKSIHNTVLLPEYIGNPEYERYTITKGKAEGILCGGSLTLINALIGTSHEIDFTDTIVFIEDVEEAPYRIDRMLTQLIEGPTFKKAAGIVFGVFAGCNKSTNPNSFTLKEVLIDRIKPLGIPAVYGMSFGHVAQNFTFPIGIRATFNTEEMVIRLMEKAVV